MSDREKEALYRQTIKLMKTMFTLVDELAASYDAQIGLYRMSIEDSIHEQENCNRRLNNPLLLQDIALSLRKRLDLLSENIAN